MKHLKYTILTNFCVIAALSIAALTIVVSQKIKDSLSRQSEHFAADMTANTYDMLNLPHHTFEMLIQEDIKRNLENLSDSPTLRANFANAQLKESEAELFAKASDEKLDLAILFNLKGQLQSSFPTQIAQFDVERYFTAWEFSKQIFAAATENASNLPEVWLTFCRFSPEILANLGLSERDIEGKGTAGIVAATVIKDDFDEPIGVCLVGRLFNQYNEPLERLQSIAGYVSVIYLDYIPIAQAGFLASENTPSDLSTLRVAPHIQSKTTASPAKSNQILTLAGKPYLTSCSGLMSSAGERVGTLCVGLPETQITTMQNRILADGIRTHTAVQWWMIGIGSLSLGVFAVLSLIMATRIAAPMIQLVNFARSVADGNLTATIEIRRADETGVLAHALSDMVVRLRDMTSAVKRMTEHAVNSSQQVRSSAAEMSQGVAKQSSAMQEVSSAMEEMVTNIRQNTENSRQTERLAQHTAHQAEESGRAVADAVNAMQQITRMSTMIEEITRQTRMLSLNASIEAARAQEHGQGFAVVAAEVRALSERSRVAAAEINRIATSGAAISEHAGAMLQQLVPNIRQTAELIQNVSAAGQEQQSGVEQINNAIQQLDQIAQQNSAMSEILETAAEELSAQAKHLQETIAFFKTETLRQN